MTTQITPLFDDGPACIECGCTEHNACLTQEGSCGWAWVDHDSDEGLCTACDNPAEEPSP